MMKDQLMQALMVIQSCPENFEKLTKKYGFSYPQQVVLKSSEELYSYDLMQYLHDNMSLLPTVDYSFHGFDYKNLYQDWDDTVRYAHFVPCCMIGRSKPLDQHEVRDVGYECYVGTFIDSNGYVFNVEIREYVFELNNIVNKLVLRQTCNDSLLRLNLMEQFFDDSYVGFWG